MKFKFSNRSLAVVCAGLYLAYSMGLALFSREGFPGDMRYGAGMPYLSDKPVGEDGFYMLTVAWHFAEGEGMSYNLGRVTTGIQPLAVWIYAGIAGLVQSSGGDRFLFVRFVIMFGSVTLVMFAFLMKRIAGRLGSQAGLDSERVGMWAFILSLYNFWLFRLFTYGLETGIYLVLIAACMLFALRCMERKAGLIGAALLGTAAGVAGLARIDFGIIFGVYLLLSFVRKRGRNILTAVSGVIAFLIVAPWFQWVHTQTGRWMPSSGSAQMKFIGIDGFFPRFHALISAVVENGVPWFYTGGRTGLMWVAVFSAVILLFWFRKNMHCIVSPVSDSLLVAADWLAGVMCLLCIYVLWFSSLHFLGRYSAPLILFAVMFWSVLFGAGMSIRFVPVVPLLFFIFALLSLHIGRTGNSHAVTAGFLKDNCPETVRVGAFQSGVVGFFSPNVVNLDGKIDAEALRHRMRGDMGAYIDEQKVDMVVDWPEYINEFLGEKCLESNWEPYRPGILSNGSICIVRKKLKERSDH